MQSNESLGGIGTPTFVLSEGKQHKPEDLAHYLAREILDISGIADEDRAAQALAVQERIAETITPLINATLAMERICLDRFEDQCTREYAVQSSVDGAISAIHAFPAHSWSDKLNMPEWVNAAKLAIGNILATVIHVERSWFASDHPENAAAQQYTSRFTGQS